MAGAARVAGSLGRSQHHLPAVVCLLVIGLLVAVNVIALTYMPSWFEGSIFESDEVDPNSGKKRYYLRPGFCTLWIFIPSLFIAWKCGKFAFKRFFFHWRPPETVKK